MSCRTLIVLIDYFDDRCYFQDLTVYFTGLGYLLKLDAVLLDGEHLAYLC